MPRVFLTRNSKREFERELACKELIGTFEKYRKMQDLNVADVCALAGIGKTRYHARLNAPDEFRLAELTAIIIALKIPADEVLPILHQILQ